MVNGVRLVFFGSFISDQLSFWVNFPFNNIYITSETYFFQWINGKNTGEKSVRIDQLCDVILFAYLKIKGITSLI